MNYDTGKADSTLVLGQGSTVHVATASDLANLHIGHNYGYSGNGTGVLEALGGEAELRYRSSR